MKKTVNAALVIVSESNTSTKVAAANPVIASMHVTTVCRPPT
jgi:hypothetical protein